jgi:hypothetical protein
MRPKDSYRATLLCVAIIIGETPLAVARACGVPTRLNHFLDTANVAYVEMVSVGYDNTKMAMRTELRVIDVFKGKLPKVISYYVDGKHGDAYFVARKKYLLFLNSTQSEWTISSCDNEGPVDLSETELRTLHSYADNKRYRDKLLNSIQEKPVQERLKEAANAAMKAHESRP